ncbi:hypothetical protein M011DRAFT_94 [Sporormia fimetaria CBS 119925]|uniref:Uncharacterized protein n=1 Tax=Sporormia fimetaria CBS 119925 TaxID=1340428 RepID=A0A6A6VQT7_9PLEO|nr:hypothetical protein M011DRAFT_94 [Sporormia fimetaria CBS 119925]
MLCRQFLCNDDLPNFETDSILMSPCATNQPLHGHAGRGYPLPPQKQMPRVSAYIAAAAGSRGAQNGPLVTPRGDEASKWSLPGLRHGHAVASPRGLVRPIRQHTASRRWACGPRPVVDEPCHMCTASRVRCTRESTHVPREHLPVREQGIRCWMMG